MPLQRRKSSDNDLNILTHEELQQLQLQQQQQQHEETIPLDWQTAALFLAVLACLLFFIVAACILIQHMRQWRRMERRLDQGKSAFDFSFVSFEISFDRAKS